MNGLLGAAMAAVFASVLNENKPTRVVLNRKVVSKKLSNRQKKLHEKYIRLERKGCE